MAKKAICKADRCWCEKFAPERVARARCKDCGHSIEFHEGARMGDYYRRQQND